MSKAKRTSKNRPKKWEKQELQRQHYQVANILAKELDVQLQAGQDRPERLIAAAHMLPWLP